MSNNEIKQVVVDSLIDLVSGSKLLKVYEYSSLSCNGGVWSDGSVAFQAGEKIAEQLGMDSPFVYVAERHEDIVINAAIVQIDMTTGEASFVTNGTQLIQFSVLNEPVTFGLNGGYDNREFTLLRGDHIDLYPMIYGGGVAACNAPNMQVFLIISDKMEPQSIVI